MKTKYRYFILCEVSVFQPVEKAGLNKETGFGLFIKLIKKALHDKKTNGYKFQISFFNLQ